MIVVRVELHKWPTGEVTELARMHICNQGGSRSARTANYSVETFRGRSTAELDRLISQRRANVMNHAKQADHVWSLVGKALIATDYIRPAVRESRLPLPGADVDTFGALRNVIAETAADLSNGNAFWTAGCLATALIPALDAAGWQIVPKHAEGGPDLFSQEPGRG